jgi:hypothetical protein
MINIDNIIKEFVEKKWPRKVVQIPRIWLTSVGMVYSMSWYFGFQISRDEGEVLGYWIKDKT